MTLEIYMKSGNIVVLDSIQKYSVEYRGNTITRLELSWKNPSRQSLVGAFDLTHIEAICLRRSWWTRLLTLMGKETP